MVTIAWNRFARIWTLDGHPICTLEGHSAQVLGASFCLQGARVLTCSADKTAKVWSLEGTCVLTLHGHTECVTTAQVSHCQQYIATASDDRTAKIWASHKGLCLQTLRGHTNHVCNVRWSAYDHFVITKSYDETIRVWSRDGRCLQTLTDVSVRWSSRLSLHPHENRIATPYVPLLALQPNFRFNFAKGQVKTWSFHETQGKESQILINPLCQNMIYALEWSPSGAFLAATDENGRVSLWTKEGRFAGTFLPDHSADDRSKLGAHGIAWSACSKCILFWSGNVSVKKWSAPILQFPHLVQELHKCWYLVHKKRANVVHHEDMFNGLMMLNHQVLKHIVSFWYDSFFPIE